MVLDAIFTFCISPKHVDIYENELIMERKNMYLSYTSGTDVFQHKTEKQEIYIVGLCVDTYGEIERENICEQLLQGAPNIDELFIRTNRLAGKYVVIFFDRNDCYLFGDATGSIQINYCYDDNMLYVASTDQVVALICNKVVSERAKKVRNGSALSQGMPGDMTMFDEVRVLLPNHYLDVSAKSAVRVPMKLPKVNNLVDYDYLIRKSIFFVENTVKEYKKRYELICPLTSGYDSRVVFSFLKEAILNLECYTFWHPSFTEKTDDLYIADQICKKYNVRYTQVHDLKATEGFCNEIKKYYGKFVENTTIDLAYTLRKTFEQKAIINGDIIDQVGKSLLGNSLPYYFATPRFFQCKIHNTEKFARDELSVYLKEIEKEQNPEQIFDLFAIENRCGRWAVQSGTIYSLAGVPSLNIFNSREILLLWMAIPRKLRVKKYIHNKVLKEKDSKLLEIPFNPSSKTDIMKKNPYVFLLATYAKYIIQEVRKKVYENPGCI